MTKFEYCKEKQIFICNPDFDPSEEADEIFKENIDKFVNLIASQQFKMDNQKVLD